MAAHSVSSGFAGDSDAEDGSSRRASSVATINDEARLNSCTAQMTNTQAMHEGNPLDDMMPGNSGAIGVGGDRCSLDRPDASITKQHFLRQLVRCMYASRRGGTYQRVHGPSYNTS